MTPNSNHDNDINIYCDWLTDNGYLADEIRFDEEIPYWHFEFYRSTIDRIGDFSWYGANVGYERDVGAFHYCRLPYGCK